MALPLIKEPLAPVFTAPRQLQSKQTNHSSNIFLSEINTIKNNLNKTVRSESFEMQNAVNQAKQSSQSDRITNGTMSVSSGDTCSISNFSGSNSRLSNNSGCSISSDEHEGIWRKLDEIADHAIGSNSEGASRLCAEESVSSATESDSIGSIRNSSPDSQPSPPISSLPSKKLISETPGSASPQTLLSRLSPRSCDFSTMVIPPPSSTPCQNNFMQSAVTSNSVQNNNIKVQHNTSRNPKSNLVLSQDNNQHDPIKSSKRSSDDKMGRLSPMVNTNANPSRLHHLQILASRDNSNISPNNNKTIGFSRQIATSSTSSLDSSYTPRGSTDLWDVRATKTPIRDLHIMTHNAKHSPVSRNGSGSTHQYTRQNQNAVVLNNHHSQGQISSLSSTSSSPNLVMKNRKQLRPPSRCQTISQFDRLPDNCVINILSFLSSNQLVKCSRISRRFYFLAWEPELWSDIVLEGGYQIDTDLALKTIIRLLSRNAGLPNKQHSLNSLVLNGCQSLTDRGLAIVARRCPHLTKLEIQWCTNITNGGLMDLVTKCPLLDHLDVTGCQMISTIGVHQPPQAPGIRSANTTNYNHHQQLYNPLALNGMSQPDRRLLNLQYLDLTDCTSLEDSGLKMIVECCPQLLYLFMRRCSSITDVAIKYVSSYCLGLRELSISDCSRITDYGMYELAKLGPNLRYLSVAKCDAITDNGIKQISRLCYKLRYLNVRGCESVSDEAIETLARSCSRLRSLDIGKCDVTDVGLKTLSENCPNLKKLSAKGCELISDQGIQTVAYYCRGLQQLNIQDCPVTVEGYRTVKKFCKRCIIEHSHPGFF